MRLINVRYCLIDKKKKLQERRGGEITKVAAVNSLEQF